MAKKTGTGKRGLQPRLAGGINIGIGKLALATEVLERGGQAVLERGEQRNRRPFRRVGCPRSLSAREETGPAPGCESAEHPSRRGRMAPTNDASQPIQMYGTGRQPMAERWVSDRKPTRARKGATSTGRATIAATSIAGTESSTIMTRLSVPTSMAKAMPTET